MSARDHGFWKHWEGGGTWFTVDCRQRKILREEIAGLTKKKTERAPNWTIQNWLEKSANSTKNTSKRISTSQHFNNR